MPQLVYLRELRLQGTLAQYRETVAHGAGAYRQHWVAETNSGCLEAIARKAVHRSVQSLAATHLQLFAREVVPGGDGVWHGRANDSGRDGFEHGLWIDVALRAAQKAFHPSHRRKAFLACEGLLHIEPSLIPTDEARAEDERRKHGQGAAIRDPNSAHERGPPRANDVLEQPRARQQVGAAVVHEVEEAGVVQMQVEIDVVGPHTHAHAILFEGAEPVS